MNWKPWSKEEDEQLAIYARNYCPGQVSVGFWKPLEKEIGKTATACRHRLNRIKKILSHRPDYPKFQKECFNYMRPEKNDSITVSGTQRKRKFEEDSLSTQTFFETHLSSVTFSHSATKEMIEDMILKKIRTNSEEYMTNITQGMNASTNISTDGKLDDIEKLPIPIIDQNPVQSCTNLDIKHEKDTWETYQENRTHNEWTYLSESKTKQECPKNAIDILEGTKNNTQAFFEIFGKYVKNKFSPIQQEEILIKVCSLVTSVELDLLLKQNRS